jgi:hypothetical protein
MERKISPFDINSHSVNGAPQGCCLAGAVASAGLGLNARRRIPGRLSGRSAGEFQKPIADFFRSLWQGSKSGRFEETPEKGHFPQFDSANFAHVGKLKREDSECDRVGRCA